MDRENETTSLDLLNFIVLSHLPTVGIKTSCGRYLHMCTVFRVLHVPTSDKCLSNIPVVWMGLHIRLDRVAKPTAAQRNYGRVWSSTVSWSCKYPQIFAIKSLREFVITPPTNVHTCFLYITQDCLTFQSSVIINPSIAQKKKWSVPIFQSDCTMDKICKSL
jgi:hypothetical protein